MSNQPFFPAGPAIAGATRQIARADANPSVPQAIADAAQQTSVEFDYLIAKAEIESAMNPDAKARTSSASGLFQFIESTWLGTMKRHGPRFGFSEVAAQIGTTGSGVAYVADSGQRQAILDMRNDPQVASLMAAGLAEDNRAHLMPILGRQPNSSELYLAHFLGAGGAGRFLNELAQDPDQNAAGLFRRPAAANRGIFFEPSGAPRSLSGVMDIIDGKMERALARVSATPGGDFSRYKPSPADPSPYVIADEAVFGPGSPPVITGENRPRITQQPTLSLPPIGSGTTLRPNARPVAMSNLLRATFGDAELQSLRSNEGNAQVKRAYDRLKALGL
ncbi:MAG: transglycosylase SLT domain-containing protein [Pseudomonadota bacterium]